MNAQLRKDKFIDWLSTQTKPNGEPYSQVTIEAYADALKTIVGKVNLADSVQPDLFQYSSPEAFQPIYHRILRQPGMGLLEEKAGHRDYTNGLRFYLAYLEGRGKLRNAWIFQANPKFYNIAGLIHDQKSFEWATKQNAGKMQKGDKVYIWKSGPDGGIVAVGELLTAPEDRPWNNEDPYQLSDHITIPGTHKAVDIRIDLDLTSRVIPRSVLAADDRTHKMHILQQPNGTNYAVTAVEESVIESLIDETYERAPIVIAPPVKDDTAIGIQGESIKYWIYAPGRDAMLWNQYLEQGVIGLGWNEIGDLSHYDSKSNIRAALEQTYDGASSIQSANMLWAFSREMNIGDIVYVKKGRSKVIGRGVIQSDHYFDESSGEYHHLRKVQWTHQGEWNWSESLLPMKTLTDATYNRSLLKAMAVFFDDKIPSGDGDDSNPYAPYERDDFLDEVFWSEKQYETAHRLLRRKKNIILQGAPGVGKTFAAERLAWSFMGEKDRQRCLLIQFHQSYGYEDFVKGYRPTATGGFELRPGPFYEFCKSAEEDDRPYFLIIDEINRGNLSKIFGELLMLIEADKRGRPIRLLYGDELFVVPKNVYIIGMMNTADRGLALIDYALRRRFAFLELEPGFETSGFAKITDGLGDGHECFKAIIDVIKELNQAISEDPGLGRGFRVGHSYFCFKDISDGCLEAVIDYEIIPLLEEYWFDAPTKIAGWTERLRLVMHGHK
ncbi:EVE domain-containing protein [Deltaproteobacteria bacterium OttesenSCG-928-M10]|nr:EVE domain-containing protein [Deltaproteobacteria bacterium OttesenSCG-928-M10]